MDNAAVGEAYRFVCTFHDATTGLPRVDLTVNVVVYDAANSVLVASTPATVIGNTYTYTMTSSVLTAGVCRAVFTPTVTTNTTPPDRTMPVYVGKVQDAADPLLNLVPGSYAAGTAGYDLSLIPALQSSLSATTVTVTTPVISANLANLVQGDAYYAADGRALDFAFTGQPSFVGGTTRITFAYASRGETRTLLSVTGTVISAGSLRFEISSVQSAILPAYTLAMEIEVTLADGHVITPTPLSLGRAVVAPQST